MICVLKVIRIHVNVLVQVWEDEWGLQAHMPYLHCSYVHVNVAVSVHAYLHATQQHHIDIWSFTLQWLSLTVLTVSMVQAVH